MPSTFRCRGGPGFSLNGTGSMVRINSTHSVGRSPIPPLVLGDFVYANLVGMPVFIIGDREAAEELLNARGRISASRPPNILTLDLCVALLPAEVFLTSPVQDGLGRVEFGIDFSRKNTLNGTVAPTESYISRCRWLVSTVD